MCYNYEYLALSIVVHKYTMPRPMSPSSNEAVKNEEEEEAERKKNHMHRAEEKAVPKESVDGLCGAYNRV